MRNPTGFRATLRENPRATKTIASRIFDPSRWEYDSPLNVFVRGTNFQIKAREALVRIPPGRAVSYAHVAIQICAPGAAGARGVPPASPAPVPSRSFPMLPRLDRRTETTIRRFPGR